MKYVCLLLTIGIVVFVFSCKTKSAPLDTPKPISQGEYDKLWKHVDSLEQEGLIASALTEVQKIRQSALVNQNSNHLVKAVLYENKYNNQLEEDAGIKAIARGEEMVLTFPEPARSVMHSLLAQWYANYLQGHMWQLRNRSEYTGPAGPDIRTWGIRHFVDKIFEHYEASIQYQGLKSFKVEDYLVLLTDAKDTDQLRPTLYDILIHRALDFSSSELSYLTKPAYAFTLTNPEAFQQAEVFVENFFQPKIVSTKPGKLYSGISNY